jgi:hypothetical protein
MYCLSSEYICDDVDKKPKFIYSCVYNQLIVKGEGQKLRCFPDLQRVWLLACEMAFPFFNHEGFNLDYLLIGSYQI